MPYLLKDSIGYRTNLAATTLKTNFTKLLQPAFNIAAEQFATLKIISEDNEVTQTQIAERLGKNKTTVGRSINSLITKEMIDKRDEKSDRRANNISLTQKGEDILNAAIPIAKNFNESVKNKLTKEDIETFFKVLDIILEESKNMDNKQKENK